MLRVRTLLLCLVLLLAVACLPAAAEDSGSLERADKLFTRADMESLKKSVKIYSRVAKEEPQNYQARWKGARACRELAHKAKLREVEGWQDICETYGKRGMELAKEAIDLRPEEVEGHYYYGVSVGSYSDGVSILTALSEGLKGKTRRHLEKAYELDKEYNDSTPVMALGRYYEVLPWIAGQDKDKALDYYKEALRLMPEDSEFRPQLSLYAGRLMLDQGVEEDRARRLLRRASESDHPHYSRKAEKLLEDS